MATQVEPEIARRRFSAEEFLRMDEAGLFAENDRLELIEGEIVEMHPIGWRHSRCVALLNALLSRQIGDELLVGVQGPVQMGGRGLPQPDFAVVRRDAFEGSHPQPGQTLLVIEVSESSLAYDRNVKLPLYARHRYPEAWIVDLGREVVERHSGPAEDGYCQIRRFAREDVVESTAVPGLRLAVDDFLG